MGTVVLHFAVGAVGSLAVFLVLTRLSGVRRFSAPFGVVFIGIACASLAHFVSPWATPVVIAIYALIGISEVLQDRKAKQPGTQQDAD
jgi:uncharacterized membrane protein YjjP (DUF1212 family)